METLIQGKVCTFGDNIDTDIIIPTKYLILPSIEEMKQHLFEPLDIHFLERVRSEDITVLVAGNNFGCGSSREQAVQCLAAAGIKAVVAKSFSRLFYRNAINNGLAALCSFPADRSKYRMETA